MSDASTETPEDDDARLEWHRTFATEAYNRAWDLMDKAKRSESDDAELLATTFASRFHWERVGSEENRMIGDWQVARVASMLGLGKVALTFAEAALSRTQLSGWDDWRLASCYEGMARAHAANGNPAERDRFVGLARDVLDKVGDADDRKLIEAQIASIPGV